MATRIEVERLNFSPSICRPETVFLWAPLSGSGPAGAGAFACGKKARGRYDPARVGVSYNGSGGLKTASVGSILQPLPTF